MALQPSLDGKRRPARTTHGVTGTCLTATLQIYGAGRTGVKAMRPAAVSSSGVRAKGLDSAAKPQENTVSAYQCP